MADIDLDQLGPVDYLVVRFPADKADFSGAMADELKKLTDGGTVRVLDLLIVTKDEDGNVDAAELRDADESAVGELRSLEAAPTWSPGARLPCSSGRTRGRARSQRRYAIPVGS
jgi:hypothetical protein